MRTVTVIFLLSLGASCGPSEAPVSATQQREREALRWIHRLDEPAIYERVVALGVAAPLLRASQPEYALAVRLAAIRALGERGDATAHARLQQLAQDDADETVRRYANAALTGEDLQAQERRTAHIAALLTRLHEPDARRELGGLEAFAPVAAVAGDREKQTAARRIDALWTLAHMTSAEAAAALAAARDDKDPLVRAHSRSAAAKRDEDNARQTIAAIAAREKKAAEYLPLLANPAVRELLVEQGAVWTLIAGTEDGRPLTARRQACLGLGAVVDRDDAARDRLLELLHAETPDAAKLGVLKLYAAVGLTMRNDPGCAIDLLLALSTVDPNDNVAALANEGTSLPYYTVDAQLCDALLQLGLFRLEDELVDQLKRRSYVRVLIDAHAVLRRETGLTLPYHYNGSYAVRDGQAEAWRKALRSSRAARYAARPFAQDNVRFQARLGDMLAWLRGRLVNDRYIAEKVLLRLGPYAVQPLVAELKRDHNIAQRQAALMLGRLGDARAGPALCETIQQTRDSDARARCLEALRALDYADAIPLARAALQDSDAEVRAQAAALLGHHRDEASADALRTALAAERLPETATLLRCAIFRVGDYSVVTDLVKAYVEGDQPAREAAFEALRGIGKSPLQAGPLDPIEDRRASAAKFSTK